eukprot:403368181
MGGCSSCCANREKDECQHKNQGQLNLDATQPLCKCKIIVLIQNINLVNNLLRDSQLRIPKELIDGSICCSTEKSHQKTSVIQDNQVQLNEDIAKVYKFLMMSSNPNISIEELDELETLCREKLRIIVDKKKSLSFVTQESFTTQNPNHQFDIQEKDVYQTQDSYENVIAVKHNSPRNSIPYKVKNKFGSDQLDSGRSSVISSSQHFESINFHLKSTNEYLNQNLQTTHHSREPSDFKKQKLMMFNQTMIINDSTKSMSFVDDGKPKCEDIEDEELEQNLLKVNTEFDKQDSIGHNSSKSLIVKDSIKKKSNSNHSHYQQNIEQRQSQAFKDLQDLKPTDEDQDLEFVDIEQIEDLNEYALPFSTPKEEIYSNNGTQVIVKCDQTQDSQISRYNSTQIHRKERAYSVYENSDQFSQNLMKSTTSVRVLDQNSQNKNVTQSSKGNGSIFSRNVIRKQSTKVWKNGHMFEHGNYENSEDSFSDISLIEDQNNQESGKPSLDSFKIGSKIYLNLDLSQQVNLREKMLYDMTNRSSLSGLDNNQVERSSISNGTMIKHISDYDDCSIRNLSQLSKSQQSLISLRRISRPSLTSKHQDDKENSDFSNSVLQTKISQQNMKSQISQQSYQAPMTTTHKQVNFSQQPIYESCEIEFEKRISTFQGDQNDSINLQEENIKLRFE